MLVVGVVAFFAAELVYGSRGPDSGAIQFMLYGLVGFIPAMLASWLSHEAIDEPGRPGAGKRGASLTNQFAAGSGLTASARGR